MTFVHHKLTRRTLLRASALAVGAGALATALPRALLAQGGDGYLPPLQVTSPNPAPDDSATVLVRDVVDYDLSGDFPWNGGSVTFRLHEGRIDGQALRFIRTDASDSTFAEEVGLVWVPLLGAALTADGVTGRLYLVDGGGQNQLPVFSTAPGMDDYTPLFQVINVTIPSDPVFGRAAIPPLFESEADIEAAIADGSATAEETATVVNYPAVSWPGGELPVDGAVELPLSGGPLLARPDLVGNTVTFKLHKCYPESRYIITDTSAVPMAPRMNIAASPASAGAAGVGAASTITVFGNGLTGPGAMGFQPGVFREKAGEPTWSPLWNHFTVVWKDADAATLLTSQEQIDALVEDGTLELFAGTPNTGGQGFVVNCPSPITAPDDFEVTAA